MLRSLLMNQALRSQVPISLTGSCVIRPLQSSRDLVLLQVGDSLGCWMPVGSVQIVLFLLQISLVGEGIMSTFRFS